MCCWIDPRHMTDCLKVFKGVQGVKVSPRTSETSGCIRCFQTRDVSERCHQDTSSRNERLLGCTLDTHVPCESFYFICRLSRGRPWLKKQHKCIPRNYSKQEDTGGNKWQVCETLLPSGVASESSPTHLRWTFSVIICHSDCQEMSLWSN